MGALVGIAVGVAVGSDVGGVVGALVIGGALSVHVKVGVATRCAWNSVTEMTALRSQLHEPGEAA